MIWFLKTVYPWRVAGSCVWLCSLSLVLLLIYHLLMFSSLLKVESLLCIIIFIVSTLLLHISQLWLLDVKVFVGRTRLKRICYTFRLSHCLFVMLSVFLATFQSFSLMSIANVENNNYVNYGSFLGLFYFIYYIKENKFILVFNSIQQAKFFQFKTSLPFLIRESITESFKSVILYMCVYIIISMRLVFLFDMWLLWLLFVNGAVMNFVWRLSLKLHYLYQTELLEFPLVASFSEDSSRTLLLGLESNNTLIKYLAYMDLARLSVQSPSRRSKVYSLSSSGGAGIWINIYNNCIGQLNTLIVSLGGRGEDTNNGFINTPLVRSTATFRKGWSDQVTTPTLSRSQVNAERAVLTVGHVQELHCRAMPTKHAPIKNPEEQIKEAVKTLSLFKRQIVSYLKKKALISYFISEIPEEKDKELLSESVLYVCIVTSLTHLAVNSRNEDKYGVVQINLPQIVKAFLELLSLLQKHVKQRFGATYYNESINQLENGKYSLRSALEEGLHLIKLTFPDTRFMNLTSEEKWKLSNVTGQ